MPSRPRKNRGLSVSRNRNQRTPRSSPVDLAEISLFHNPCGHGVLRWCASGCDVYPHLRPKGPTQCQPSGKLVFERRPGEMPTSQKYKTPTGWPDLITVRIALGDSHHRSQPIRRFDSGCSLEVISFVYFASRNIICFLFRRPLVLVVVIFWPSLWDFGWQRFVGNVVSPILQSWENTLTRSESCTETNQQGTRQFQSGVDSITDDWVVINDHIDRVI